MTGHAAPVRSEGSLRVVRATCMTTLACVVLLTACDVNPYDASQVPQVRVTPTVGASRVVISWQPEGAQLVRVYAGSVAGDGYTTTLVWSIAAIGSNTLVSGVDYGALTPTGGRIDVPAKALVSGQTYTVQVTRADPKGSGDGFTNTSNHYVGTQTFTVGVASVP